jgi:hypothetical protein
MPAASPVHILTNSIHIGGRLAKAFGQSPVKSEFFSSLGIKFRSCANLGSRTCAPPPSQSQNRSAVCSYL